MMRWLTAAARPAGTEDVLRSFVQGLVQPSVLAVATALSVLVTAFVAYWLVFGAWFTASDLYRYQMDDPFDVQTQVTHKVLRHGAVVGPRTLVLGNSVTKRCVASEAALSKEIAARRGFPMTTLDLITDAQATWEMAAIVDRMSPGDGDVLVIGLGPGTLRIPVQGEHRSALSGVLKWPKLGFTSEALDAEARRLGLAPPWRTGIHAIDNSGFVLARRKTMVRNLLRGAPEPADPLTAPWYSLVNTPEHHAGEIAAIGDVVQAYDAHSAVNLEVLERLVQQARRAGDVRVVVLESPVHPGWQDVPAGRRFFARYRADLAALAERLDARLMLATEAAALTAADFVDFEGHLGNAAARARCTEALAGTIADVLMEET